MAAHVRLLVEFGPTLGRPTVDTSKGTSVSFEQFMERFSPEQRARIDAHAEQLVAEELSLRDLRKAMGKTRAQLARKLNKPQASVSRMEKQSDMLISTLDEIVHAMGGRVRIVAELPGRPPLYLTGLTGLAETKVATTKSSRATARRTAAAK
jgi:hypothetical protein